MESKTGLTIKCKTANCAPDKNGVVTIKGTEKNKSFTGTVNKELANVVKDAAGASETAKFNVGSNMTNQEGKDVFVDDNEDAWDAPRNNGVVRTSNVDIADIQDLDSQTPELGMALVGHFLSEGIAMRTPGANYYNTGTPGAHDIGLEKERKILTEATGIKQATRYAPQPISPTGQVTTAIPFSFVYTTVQYDISLKNGVTVTKVSPPTIQRSKK